MANIIRTPTHAEGGITPAEKLLMDEHASGWIANALRTDTVDRVELTRAVKDLYRVSGKAEPLVVIVPSPRILAFASGFACVIWHLRERAATRAATAVATRAATHDATRAATYVATDDATRAATRAATYDATYAATRAATYAATDDATDDATYVATDDATYVATRAATYVATDDATYAATRAATYDATYAATDDATDVATYDATYAATYVATYVATDDATDDATRAATRAATYDATRAATYVATYVATDDATAVATRAATDDATDDATDTTLFAQIARDILGPKYAAFGLECARQWSRCYQGGNMWAAWDCYLTAVRDILGLRLPSHTAYAAWERCARNGGFRFVHEKFCMVSDFPERLCVDAQHHPHSEDGPSHRWRDGWSLWYWHGVQVTEQIVMRPATLTVVQIEDEPNAEVRRVMIERYGTARYLKDAGAELVHELPENYYVQGLQGSKLYRKARKDDSYIVMVILRNSTPEPDGSVKEYHLRVQPDAYAGAASRNCHAAVASTWRKQNGALYFAKPEDYRPGFES